jgi:hypothetical protein
METIEKKFDEKVLPAWARKNAAVVALAERNLAFRADVCDSTKQSKDWQRIAIRTAKK